MWAGDKPVAGGRGWTWKQLVFKYRQLEIMDFIHINTEVKKRAGSVRRKI